MQIINACARVCERQGVHICERARTCSCLSRARSLSLSLALARSLSLSLSVGISLFFSLCVCVCRCTFVDERWRGVIVKFSVGGHGHGVQDVRRCWHANGRPSLRQPTGPVYELFRQVSFAIRIGLFCRICTFFF